MYKRKKLCWERKRGSWRQTKHSVGIGRLYENIVLKVPFPRNHAGRIQHVAQALFMLAEPFFHEPTIVVIGGSERLQRRTSSASARAGVIRLSPVCTA
jgi:hypothetical protein